MGARRLAAGGGLAAVAYVLRKGREAGGLLRLYRRLRSRNACKTCALGMGGQRGGMVNEAGHFPEVCKKSVQAQAGDMAAPIGEDFFRRTPLAALARMSAAEMERLGRLAFPILAEEGDTHFRRVSWSEALDRAGAALRAAPPAEVFFYSSGRSSNEAAFLLQLVARAYGTANIHNCSFYCHHASSVALNGVYGSSTASVSLDDLRRADLALVIGANPASNHPRLIAQLVELRRRGGKVIVVNPLRELGLVRFRVPSDWRSMLLGSDVADLYLQPHVGGDVALLKALLKAVLERGGVARDFVAAHTTGWDAVEGDLASSSWDVLEREAGVARAEIARAADALVGARRGVFLWAMGLTHHAHGVDNVLALANLALARGWLGRPGCGLLPVRGHSNVQGVGTCGVTPALKDAFAARLEELYGIPVHAGVGQDTYSSMVAADEGRVRVSVLLGGNLFASNPDRAWSGAALRRVGLSLSLTTKLNEGHVHGRGRTALVVPVLARDEEEQATTQESMFNFVRLSEGGMPAVAGEMRSEVDVIAALAELILPPGRFDWSALRSHRRLRQEIARVVPGMAPIARIDDTRVEFHVAGRTFHEPRFATADGRARFHVTPLPDLGDAPFRLMTLRSEGQFNTVVYEEEDVYRGTSRRDVVLMAAEDAARLGVEEGERVRVETDTGGLEVTVTIAPIRAGSLAMYYPEANALVPRRLDPRSRTPAFKSVGARVRPVAARLVGAAGALETPRAEAALS
jgi:molybdopterin-dependent oxidoreductase alpha subunit